MTLQNILSYLRKAVNDYGMINDGDKIAVGLSGGKDSLTLLAALKSYQKFSPQKFELAAIYIDLGFKDIDAAEIDAIKAYCEGLNVKLHIIPTDIASVVFDERKEKNPCSLCSKMRRGALCDNAKKLGYNKIALGHHADDLSETFLLSLLYEGRLSTFQPVTYMDRTQITVIRPLLLLKEKDIRSFAKNLPVLHNPCPVNKHTQREYVKNLIADIQKDVPFVKERLHSAIISPERYNLFDKFTKKE